ncbi:MAG: hypothetical protein ACR2QE_05380 [Acidimicrobiales bacterium]
MEFSDAVVFIVVVGARFLVPLLIPRFPLPAILAALVIDAADQTIFQQFTDLDLDGYQGYDKALDIYYLTIAYISAMRNWASPFAFSVARVLWYYRLVGVVLFEMTEERWLLLVFANTFEYFFIFYEGVRTKWNPARLGRRGVVGAAAFIWIFIKLPQEWWIHIAQLDFTDFMKEDVFGSTSDASWGEAMANRPGVTALLVAALVGIGVLAYYGSKRLPPADWSFTIDSDVVGRHLGWEAIPDGVPHEKVFGWPAVEKIFLLTLVSAIFGQVLGTEASGLQMVAAVALIVVTNAAISQWRGRRAMQWSSTFVQFIALTIANVVLLTVFAAVMGTGGDTQFDFSRAVFFAVLLTLIIVLFDRYRRIRSARQLERNMVDDADPLVGFAGE